MFDNNTPMYAWVRDYSHTDRRHWFQILTEWSVDEDITKPECEDAFLVLVRKLPLSADDPIYDKDAGRMQVFLTLDIEIGTEQRPYLGATWSGKTPDKLRISTRRCARAQDVETYAMMDAEGKGFVPLVIELVN